MLSGLTVVVLGALSAGAPRFLPEELAGPVMRGAYVVVPTLMLILVILTRIYPSELTLDALATRLPASTLSADAEAYAGRKVSVRGRLGFQEHTGNLEVRDASGAVFVGTPDPYDKLNELGAEVVAIGTVREHPSWGWTLVVDHYKIVTPAAGYMSAAENWSQTPATHPR